MLPVNVPQEDDMGRGEDQIVADPMGRELEEMWNGRASVNTQAFNKVFRCVPAAGILNWKDYEGKKCFNCELERRRLTDFSNCYFQNTCRVVPMHPRCAMSHQLLATYMKSR
jgi:hypothetical protein